MAAAKSLADRLTADGELLQIDAVDILTKTFGNECVYENENGNFAIDKNILSELRKLTESDFVWDRGERLWRKRQSWDPIGKRQAD